MRPQHTTPDEGYGKPAVCDRCGDTVHRATHLGLPWDLDPPTPITHTIGPQHMQWHPNVAEWCGVWAGHRTWRETRAIHSHTCPVGNTAGGETAHPGIPLGSIT